MVDLHSHFLPYIDDGAKDKEEAMMMLVYSFMQGVRTVVATPHCIVHSDNDIELFIQRRKKSFDSIKNEIEKDGFPKILLGAEVYLDNDISKYKNIHMLTIEGSNAILVEFPSPIDKTKISEWLYSLTLIGLKPIVAHIERYPNCIGLVKECNLIKVAYQINCTAFFTIKRRLLVKRLIKHGKEFYISSDMHNISTRRCNMEKAKRIITKKFKNHNLILYR